MGIGVTNNFKSENIVYSTPRKLFEVISQEFNFNKEIRKSNESVKTLSLAYGVSVNTIYSILSNDNDPKRIASKRKRNSKVIKPCSPDPEY